MFCSMASTDLVPGNAGVDETNMTPVLKDHAVHQDVKLYFYNRKEELCES
jgi:hypothetical protein